MRHYTRKLIRLPKQGSLTRELYDLLQANKGYLVDVPEHLRDRVYYLRDMYHQDIYNLYGGKFVLAGEYIGKSYQDYTIL